MSGRLLASFFAAFLLSVAVLGGAGFAVAPLVVPPPRDLFRAVGFDFELAPGWQCELEETEHVCRPAGGMPYPAIAVIAMKERGPQDTFKAYEDHLNDPHKSGIYKDRPDLKVISVRRRTIGAHDWIEGLHDGSEVPNYQTYYLATVTSFLGILVTMSVHRDHAPKYIAELNAMMRTLNVYQR